VSFQDHLASLAKGWTGVDDVHPFLQLLSRTRD
jgi:hypothetical protein